MRTSILGSLWALWMGGSAVLGGIVLNEPFDYADGPVATVSSGLWQAHSGTAGQADVSGGALRLTQAETEDVNTPLAGQPYAVDGNHVLYARVKAAFASLPTGTPGYFAHFKDASTGFRGRFFATTNAAAEGCLRIGVSNGDGSPSVVYPLDLILGAAHQLVMRYDVSTATTTLWIDPVQESDPSVTAVDNASVLAIVGWAFRQSGGIGGMGVDEIVVGTAFGDVISSGTGGEDPPAIAQQPAAREVEEGGTATLSVVATGTAPLRYQWLFENGDLEGETNAALTLFGVTTNQAGEYRVRVVNLYGQALSDPARLTVKPPAGPVVAEIAHVRSQVDPALYTPTNTTALHTVEGVVTTHVNLTGPGTNWLFYLQDATAGIAVFWTGGAERMTVAAGDKLRVTAPLTHYNGLLELAPTVASAQHEVVRIATNQPLPAARPLEPGWTNTPSAIEGYEGSYVVVSNATIDLTVPNFPAPPSGGTVNIATELGEAFVLRVDPRTDIAGQAKPVGTVTIYGVLGQYDTSAPRLEGYQLIPTRMADIVGALKAPSVRFTNVLENLIRPGDAPTNQYSELVLRPGERVRITAEISDDQELPVTVATPGEIPPGGQWAITPDAGSCRTAVFTCEAAAADAGQAWTIELRADNGQLSSAVAWTLYVPTVVEQQVIVSEFLANPPSSTNHPCYNPLMRDPPVSQTGVQDEYIELVNRSGADLNLAGWSIADAVSVRHRFYESFILGSSNSVVIYGGPLNGDVPNLDVPVAPASEGTAGLALNNTGTEAILVRNASDRLVARVFYTGADVSGEGALARFPDLDGPFVPQAWIAMRGVTPGRQYTGQVWTEPAAPLASIKPVRVVASANESVSLQWEADPQRPYTIWQTDDLGSVFVPVRYGLTFADNAGLFNDAASAGSPQRFYWISAPE